MAEKYTSSAKVIDGVLIISLPDAITPVVWQMELGQSKSSALEIRNTDADQFSLVLKTPRADALDIATYANRDQAIKALLVVSGAMEKARGQMKSAAEHSYPVPATSYHGNGIVPLLKKILRVTAILFGGIITCALILFVIGKLFFGTQSSPTTSASNAPVSADDFFENR